MRRRRYSQSLTHTDKLSRTKPLLLLLQPQAASIVLDLIQNCYRCRSCRTSTSVRHTLSRTVSVRSSLVLPTTTSSTTRSCLPTTGSSRVSLFSQLRFSNPIIVSGRSIDGTSLYNDFFIMQLHRLFDRFLDDTPVDTDAPAFHSALADN